MLQKYEKNIMMPKKFGGKEKKRYFCTRKRQQDGVWWKDTSRNMNKKL